MQNPTRHNRYYHHLYTTQDATAKANWIALQSAKARANAAILAGAQVFEPILPGPEILISAQIVVFGEKTTEGRLVEAVAIPWREIIKQLDRDPNFLYQIDCWKMEELIAGAYKKQGWPEVILTPRSGDKGRDVITTWPGIGSIRFIDQVKRYAPNHVVTAEEVRAMLGVLTRDPNVSKAIVTTTSHFAPGIHDEFRSFVPYRLELKDRPILLNWLQDIVTGRKN